MPNHPETDDATSIVGLGFFPRQWKAVTASIGPVLVLAGPGSGKTRCIAGRVAYLVQRIGADPSRICAITFTNKAAHEIAMRVRNGLGAVAENLTLGTIHSLCLRILRPYAKQMELPPGFGVADEVHQRLILRSLGVHEKRHGGILTRFGRRRLEGYEITAGEEETFQRYLAQLRTSRLIDYDDILILTRQLLERGGAVLADIREKWDHILVDEFQDLDLSQYEILKSLSSKHKAIFGVGDDEQSIFSWRGADPRVIVRFMKDFGIESPIFLDTNCRCSKAIFDTARRVLPRALPAGLLDPRRDIAAVRDSDFSVETSKHSDEEQEARWVVEHLRSDHQSSGISLGEYAILYRTHETGEHLEQSLIASGIPCQLGKGKALVDDSGIAQLLSSLRLILDPDSELELERLARLVLSEGLVAELLASPGTGFRVKLRHRAESKSGTEARSCWRLLYQVESLRSLAKSGCDLAQLIGAVLSLGIGSYTSPLDDIAHQLPDPASDENACALARKFQDVEAHRGTVFIVPCHGLETPLKRMVQKVIAGIQVDYLRVGISPSPCDLVLDLATRRNPVPAGEAQTFFQWERSRSLTVFAALQLVESKQFRKVFPEYVVFDTETTDKDIDACQVVELAAVRVRDGIVVDQFQRLIRCSRPISSGAAAVHGYADSDLVGKPLLNEIWPEFRRFIGDAVLIAHNGQRFDVPVLRRLTSGWDGLAGVSFFDSLPLARYLFPTGGLRLEDLAVRFCIDAGRSHHALDDSMCLASVFEKLQDERLRRARVTCLANLLDELAIALAIEGPPELDQAHTALFRKGARRALGRFSSSLEEYREETGSSAIPCVAIDELVERLGGRDLQNTLRRESSSEDRFPEIYSRIQTIVSMANGDNLDDSIRRFLDQVALSRSDGVGVDPHRVSLLTFHATKGLEFSRVYVIGVEDFQLPGYLAITEKREDEINEARRLLYVAMTRAKDRLCLTHCMTRKGRPTGGNLFLSEMGLVENNPNSPPTPN